MTEDDRIQAGELALGVLDGDDRAAALRRVIAEPEFAAEVARWRRHLAGLIGAFPEAAPPSDAERRVLARIDGNGDVGGHWWVAASAAMLAASLVLLIARPAHRDAAPAPKPAHLLVATLAGDAGKPFTAVYDARAERVSVIGAPAWAADRSAELWVIAPGKPPSPLGLLGAGDRSGIALGNRTHPPIAAGATLAVSIEPRGGSPTGLPTGPVVATGGLIDA